MIKNELKDKTLYQEISAVIDPEEYYVLEVSEHEEHGRCNIRIVIQAAVKNTSIEDCTKVHKLLFPRLELLRSSRDIYLEVSTPGIQRTIKDAEEFKAFTDKQLKIMIIGSNEWIFGRLIGADEESISLQMPEERIEKIKFEDIHKAKLVYNWEDRS